MTGYAFPIVVGGDVVSSEKVLLTRVESGPMMNGPEAVRFIVVHCTATRPTTDYTPQRLLSDHRARGFRTVGYHFYVRRDGMVTQHRRLLEVGAHARGYNRCSVAVCYEGGLDAFGLPSDTRTPAQRRVLSELIASLRRVFPSAIVVGHRDLPGVSKACPCFDAAREYGG